MVRLARFEETVAVSPPAGCALKDDTTATALEREMPFQRESEKSCSGSLTTRLHNNSLSATTTASFREMDHHRLKSQHVKHFCARFRADLQHCKHAARVFFLFSLSSSSRRRDERLHAFLRPPPPATAAAYLGPATTVLWQVARHSNARALIIMCIACINSVTSHTQ